MVTTRTVFVEVTNTLDAPSTTGIQRVLVEMMRRRPEPGDGLVVEPIRWIEPAGRFRRLTDDEWRALLTSRVAPPPADGGLRDRVADLPGARPAMRTARRVATMVSEMAHDGLRVDTWPDQAVFADLEASWHNPLPRSILLPELTGAGVCVVALHHDLFPLHHPEWFEPRVVERFLDHAHAHIAHSRLSLCNSAYTERQVVEFAESCSPPRHPVTSVLHLGADFDPTEPERAPVPDADFILCVGTIEPRKNQQLVLDAFDLVRDRHPDLHLVLAGRAGWQVDDVIDRIRRHPSFGSTLHWLTSAGDAQVEDLYRRCLLVVVPSRAEGFGLPVVEALRRGAAVISSTGGALLEAGGDLVEYVDPDGPEGLAALIDLHLTDPEHHARRRALAHGYQAPTWDRCADELWSAVSEVRSS